VKRISKTILADEIVVTIRSVVGSEPVALHEPTFSGNELIYLKECLDSTFVSSVGKYVDRFENEIAEFTGSKHAIAVVNGTAALHIALKLAGVMPGDEVLVPTLTFVATANAVTYCGAIPHFVDSEEMTLGIDVEKLKTYLSINTKQRSGQCINISTGRVIRALVPMHTFGHPSDLESLQLVADKYHLALIEDAAESLGSYYRDRHTGTFGLFGTLSFNGNKTITTGGGGVILTDNEQLARHAKHLTTTAKIPHAWEYNHDEIGYNYRMPNINAALGCAQLEQLPLKLKGKRSLYQAYKVAFASISGVRLVNEPPYCRSNFWLQTILLDSEYANQRDHILKTTNEVGLMTRPVWGLLHQSPAFIKCETMDCTCAENLSRRLINIPSSKQLI